MARRLLEGLIVFVISFIVLTAIQAVGARASGIYVVLQDNGGVVDDYVIMSEYLKSKDVEIRIDGTCASACLVLLNASNGSRFCATDRARLGWHTPYIPQPSGIYTSAQDHSLGLIYKKAVESLWPEKLRKAFKTMKIPDVYKGASPNDAAWIEGKKAQELIGACSGKYP